MKFLFLFIGLLPVFVVVTVCSLTCIAGGITLYRAGGGFRLCSPALFILAAAFQSGWIYPLVGLWNFD